MGIDSTTKTEGETNRPGAIDIVPDSIETMLVSLVKEGLITAFNIVVTGQKLPLMIISAKRSVSDDIVERIIGRLKGDLSVAGFKLIIIVDDTVDVHDPAMVAWQLLGNSDPVRDHYYIFSGTLLIDGTIKLFRKAGFARKWPNVVCSDNETIKSVDAKWQQLSLGNLIPSPSLRYLRLKRSGRDEISLD